MMLLHIITLPPCCFAAAIFSRRYYADKLLRYADFRCLRFTPAIAMPPLLLLYAHDAADVMLLLIMLRCHCCCITMILFCRH